VADGVAPGSAPDTDLDHLFDEPAGRRPACSSDASSPGLANRHGIDPETVLLDLVFDR
jgi:hypothetical protein